MWLAKGREQRTRRTRRLMVDLTLDKDTRIPELSTLLDRMEELSDTVRVFRSKDGHMSPVHGLWKTNEVAVAWSIIPDGMLFDEHTHDAEREHIVIVSGVMKYMDDDREILLRKGDAVDVPAGIPHSVEAVGGDVLVIAITIPPSEVFPNGP